MRLCAALRQRGPSAAVVLSALRGQIRQEFLLLVLFVCATLLMLLHVNIRSSCVLDAHEALMTADVLLIICFYFICCICNINGQPGLVLWLSVQFSLVSTWRRNSCTESNRGWYRNNAFITRLRVSLVILGSQNMYIRTKFNLIY